MPWEHKAHPHVPITARRRSRQEPGRCHGSRCDGCRAGELASEQGKDRLSDTGRYDDPTELALRDRPFQAAAALFVALTVALLFWLR